MDRQEIAALADEVGFPKISIYFPTHEKGREIQQDPIRLKNALAQAAAELERAGWRGSDIDTLLAEARAQTEYSDFWLHQGRSLGVFIDGEGKTRFVQLPEETRETVVVAQRYHLRPLIRMFGSRRRGYLLAATRDLAALYEVTRYDMRRLKVEGIPEGIQEVREEHNFQADMDFHPNMRGSVARSQGGAEGRPQFHGQGPSPEDYDQDMLLEYLGRVARAVDDHLDRFASGAPVALVAEPRTYGHLRPLVKYRGTVEEGLKLNPAAVDEKDLHRRGWEVLVRSLDGDRDAALERLQAQLGSNGGMQRDVAALAKAAVEGRLDTVFLEPGAHRWGQYDVERHDVAFADGPGSGHEDLIDFIAVRTLQQGGTVYPFDPAEAERLGPVAGVLRF